MASWPRWFEICCSLVAFVAGLMTPKIFRSISKRRLRRDEAKVAPRAAGESN